MTKGQKDKILSLFVIESTLNDAKSAELLGSSFIAHYGAFTTT